MDQDNAVSVVEDLIETCKDGQKGYKDAAEHAKRSDLKTYFYEQGLERGRFAEELQAELPRLGKPDKKVSGSVSAALHRAWIDTILAAVTTRSWNPLSKVRTMPKRAITKRWLRPCLPTSPRWFASRRRACNARMTR
jgi:hypothetical protein